MIVPHFGWLLILVGYAIIWVGLFLELIL